MKEFRTEIIPTVSSSPVCLKDKIFTIGSCFSDEIGRLLTENKFTVSQNPFGIVYNPVSIHQLLFYSLHKIFPAKDSYSQNGDVHFNYNFHSSFSSLDLNDLQTKIKNSITESNLFLGSTNRLIITYGTAFVYSLRSKDVVVANCHKMPPESFYKQLLTEEEILKSFRYFYSQLKEKIPSVKIILTLSPVQHLKDTLELNAVSKSTLRLSCHSIVNQFSDVEYFPAYEILLDDLRDYRFYKTDRLHPTEEAVDYIWQKFADAYFDEPAKRFLVEWQKIKNDLAHRAFHPRSEQHQKFLKNVLSRLEKLDSSIDVTDEIRKLRNEIL